MNNNEQIWVRKKTDHSRVREMTVRAFEVNSDKWEIVPNPQAEEDRSQLAIQAAKKKAAPVVTADSDYRIGSRSDTVTATDEHKVEFVDVDSQNPAGLSDDQFLISTVDLIAHSLPVPSDFDILRNEYEIKSGKQADKRWKETRIKMELDKLNNPDNAQA
jgi:hypothetical protein